MGAAGCADLDNWANRELWFPVYQEEKFVGALGSGDSAIAGFLSAFVWGHSIESCLRYANAAGSMNVTVPDGLTWNKGFDDLTRRIKAGWKTKDLNIDEAGWKKEARSSGSGLITVASGNHRPGNRNGRLKMAKKSNAKRDAFISKKLAKMSLEEKVGQLLTFTRRGAMLTPSGIEQITRLQCGGLCLEPYAVETCKNLYWGNSQIDQTFKKPADYFTIANTYFAGKTFGISITPEDYTKDLNRLQKIAVARRSGIPLHMTIDFEGDFKNDYMAGGIRQFPPPMGMAAIGDPKLTYKIGLTIAKQLTNIGVTQMYSPVCDVNINPKNPEIGIRSFSDDPEICAKHAVALIRGLQDGGIAATAKHFPGRGDSATDAHDVLDVIRADKKRMQEVELVPFKAAIAAGVKAIMTGHSVYPAYDDKYPTTLSERLLTGLLREELGFDGVIVSDAIGMAAILKQWPLPRACAMAIKAGCDTILLKADDESRSQCFFGIKQAVETGDLSEKRLNEAVTHLLSMKYDQGLFETAGKKDPKKAQDYAMSKPVIDFSWDVAKKALITMRDDKKMLPLRSEKKHAGHRAAHPVRVRRQGPVHAPAYVLRGDGTTTPRT